MILQITEDIVRAIHQAIHSDATEVEIEGKTYPITKFKTKFRSVKLGSILFAEQNTDKPSQFSALAKKGHKITWGIRSGGWIKVVDDAIHIPPYTFTTLNS